MTEIRTEDLINAVGLYKAKEAAAYGSELTDATTIGNMAAVMTDIKEAEIQYINKEITEEVYKERLKQAIFLGFVVFIDIAINKDLDLTKDLIKDYMPLIIPIVTTVWTYIGSLIKEKVLGGVVNTFNCIREKLKI